MIYSRAMNLNTISTTLINHASQGDPDSLNRLMELSEWLLLRMVSRLLHNKQDMEDVVQETLSAVVKVMDTDNLRLKHGRHSFIRLLKTCLRNVSSNHFRKKQITPTGGTDNLNHLHNLIDETVETVQETRDIAEGLIELARLSENEKRVLRQVFISGKTAQDISKETELTYANVRKIQSRALYKIRVFLGEV
ncbi:RNA polymerase sigma factor [Gimesia panareensis]|uniref:RNA polymerase sigma factor n=2 Tax=Gimesia panareensis TaxID=2527978 RepID=A0A517Q7D4_9PLAN|nr:RNA polymerase sigma factor [Gimesia panareensis]QDV17098.1 RNA polymerase sigma factor [Gimesia panareensis]